MKIKSINAVGRKDVYDISVAEEEHYVLENGVVSHNTGGIYSSDDIWIIGRRQQKDGAELVGYQFVINVEKSRTLREKSKIPLDVAFEGGVKTHSALFDIAMEGKYIARTKPGWFVRIDHDTGEVIGSAFRQKATEEPAFWDPIFAETDFNDYIRSKYRLDNSPLIAATKAELEIAVEEESEYDYEREESGS